MDVLLDFLAHGGVKLIIIAIAIGAHFMKRNAEKALREGQPRDMPNAMPSQNAMTVQNPTAPPQPNIPPVPTSPPPSAPKPPVTPPPAASKPKSRSDSGSPWSSSTNPFDGKKK